MATSNNTGTGNTTGGEALTLGDRYRFERAIGSGAQGRTFVARDLEDDSEVLVKHFHVEAADDWKAVELFDRAATVLQSLDHPAIPAYRAHFETRSGDSVQLCLVRELVPGKSLQDHIDEGRSFDEDTVTRLLEDLLDALRYLHDQSPPVIHRDIKPSNIIVRPDGAVSLVDFGAVQAELLTEIGGSTIVGTAGYVAPEQLMGRAMPASDIYALGVTMVHVLTHVEPTEIPTQGFELDFRERLEASAEISTVLEAMTRVDHRERLASAAAVMDALDGPGQGAALVERRSGQPMLVPRGSKLEAIEEDGDLVVRTPSKVLYWRPDSFSRWSKMTAYSVFATIMSMPLVWIASILVFEAISSPVGLLAGPFLWLAGVAVIWSRRRRLTVTFGEDQLHIQQPPFRPRPTSGQGRDKVSGHRIRTPDVWIKRSNIFGASVIREKQGGGTEDVWKLRIACVGAETNPPSHPFSSERRVIHDAVILELNLTHGETIWLARKIDEYAPIAVATRPVAPWQLDE